MKRFVVATALFLIAAGTASADYILIKIDVNKLNIFPSGPGMFGAQIGNAGGEGGGPQPGGFGGPGGGGLGFMGGAGGGMLQPPKAGGGFAGFTGQPPPMPLDPNGQPIPGAQPLPQMDDPDAKWVSAVVEINGLSKVPSMIPNIGYIFGYEHKWSAKNNFLPYSPHYPWVSPPVQSDIFLTEYLARFAKEKNAAKANKDKLEGRAIADNFLSLARWTLSRGQIDRFHKVMEEAEKADPKHPIVKNYRLVKKALDLPFRNEDPAQRDFLQSLVQTDYKATVSKKGHYAIYSPSAGSDRTTDALVAHRLALMEETLESFYYWFAVQKEATVQPNLPKYRLNAILEYGEPEFKTRHSQWGSVPMVGDGFTPRRDNLIVMSAKVRLNDPAFQEFDRLLDTKLRDANTKLEPFKVVITRDDLISGKTAENKWFTSNGTIFLAAAQTAALLHKTMEDRAERQTVSNEAVRQLLIASEMLPRHVQIPDWMTEGLAALFETTPDSVYPTIGGPSWTHAVSFKYLRAKKLLVAKDVLYNVVTDGYFQYARYLAKEAQLQPRDMELQQDNKDAWETARCTSWAFVYYLATKGKLDYLFNYGKELDKLPRDMDLNDLILQNCFAEGFDMKDSQNGQLIDPDKLDSMAKKWFAMMQTVNLKPADVQLHYEQQRAKADEPPPAPGTTIPNSTPTVSPLQPGVNPNQPKQQFQPPNAGQFPNQNRPPNMRPPVRPPQPYRPPQMPNRRPFG